MDFPAIHICLDVGDELIARALAPARSPDESTPRERVFGLLEHLARIARPATGAPKILMVAAHIGKCDWLGGELMVRLLRDGDQSTRFELLVGDILSAESMLGPLSIGVPIEEFQNAVRLRPDMVQPLVAQGKREQDRLVLRTTSLLRRTTEPPLFSAVAGDVLRGVARDALASPRVPADLADTARAPPVPVPLPPHMAEALGKLKKKPPKIG